MSFAPLLSVIPAKAGPSSLFHPKDRRREMDARFRGNDGVKKTGRRTPRIRREVNSRRRPGLRPAGRARHRARNSFAISLCRAWLSNDRLQFHEVGDAVLPALATVARLLVAA